MAGTITMGMPLPREVVAKVVIGVSSMPEAIFPIVFAVHGAIRSRSAVPPSPQDVTCSTMPERRVTVGIPVA
jgi:hypothetical protein